MAVEGLYEQVIDLLLSEVIAEEAELEITRSELDPADSHIYLARHLEALLRVALRSQPGNQKERVRRQIDLCNTVVSLLRQQGAILEKEGEVMLPGELLLELRGLGQAPLQRPKTPLANSWLFTGAREEPNLAGELKREIASADEIDILVSFIKWSGLRLLADELTKFTSRGNTRLRVVTTSYMGATDPKAVEFLSSLPNTEVRVSYDTKITRLHAKAYLFLRRSGFSTSCVGSSNISNPAMTEGLEWNLKVSAKDSPHILEKIRGTFNTYWADSGFRSYQSAIEEDRRRFRSAIAEAKGTRTEQGSILFYDLRPFDFQEEILEKLEVARKGHGRWRNLIVAATGTGKTVVSAFDYRRFVETSRQNSPGGSCRLMYVAHRKEILEQSLQTFRQVLRDANFGDLLVGGSEPNHDEHLFISIQSLNTRALTSRRDPDYYDFIVVDEFHHAAAPSYQSLLDHFSPKVLLGLTATPERTDGMDVLKWFEGEITAEIRLPEAIQRRLLAPFQYFGVTDTLDLRGLRWSRGRYDSVELENIVTGNDIRAGLVLDAVDKYLADPQQMRALCFCVSQSHAKYMADFFNSRGLPAAALDANSSNSERTTIQNRLVRRDINLICVVDLYNEGVDIPEVDTVLFLRPTESLTVFLQQLGRGLRLHPDKECLTVLDFIGQANRHFRFGDRYRALLGRTHRNVRDEIETGFPHLPAGCSIELEKVARERVLENVRQATLRGRRSVISAIRRWELETTQPLTLASFLKYHAMSLSELYGSGFSWKEALDEAGEADPVTDSDLSELRKGLARLARTNSPKLIRVLRKIAMNSELRIENLAPEEKSLLLMLHYDLWRKPGPELDMHALEDSLGRLQENPNALSELKEISAVAEDQIDFLTQDLDLPYPCPLDLHARYNRDEILAGFGHHTFLKQKSQREGVLFLAEKKTELLLVTLNKSEKKFSPTTMYEDYAISPTLFHWQSQSRTSPESLTGQRYINQERDKMIILLFVRDQSYENGLACPFTFLGPVTYVSHEGRCPMSIIWKLGYPMPVSIWRESGTLSA